MEILGDADSESPGLRTNSAWISPQVSPTPLTLPLPGDMRRIAPTVRSEVQKSSGNVGLGIEDFLT